MSKKGNIYKRKDGCGENRYIKARSKRNGMIFHSLKRLPFGKSFPEKDSLSFFI